MKKISLIVLCSVALLLMAACGKTAPTAITAQTDGIVLRTAGDTADLAALLSVEGAKDEAQLVYVSSDPSVADVSDAGLVTAAGNGTATITVSAAADASVFAAIDVLVADYTGGYTAAKYIDAMGCDIRVTVTLHADGTFDYYRDPMTVDLDGGGEMPGLSDSGSYTVNGSSVTFAAEKLGEYTLQLRVADGRASLEGKIPTGGAPTQMTLLQYTEQAEDVN